MADEATSVGKIQLDIEITKSSIAREMEGLSKAFNSGIKGSFGNIGGQMTGFIKSTIGGMLNSFKSFSQVGSESNKKIAQSTDDISIKMQQLVNQMESATNRAEMHRQKLLELQAQYDRLSRMGMGDSDKGRKLLDQITLTEDKVNRYGAVSDRTRFKIEQLEQSMANLGEIANKSNRGFKNAEEGSRKAGRSFKLFGDQASKSSSKVGGFAAMISRSFRTVLRRLFVYSLILKSIRGMMNYMNAGLKTNKQFASSLNVIGTNLRVAFQPIYDFILPALNALMKGIATVTTYIATAISSLFGKTYKQSYDSAKGLETAKKAMEGYGKAAKKTKGALAGFDEINQLDISKDEDDSRGFAMSMPDLSTIDMTGVNTFFENLGTLFQPTINAVERLKVSLEPLKSFVAQGLYDFYNNFLVPVGKWTFGEGLPRFIDIMTKGLASINWQSINTGLNNLWIALTPFAINVGQGLLWFWENVLVSLGTWTMNEIVPRFLGILAEAIRVLNNVIEALKPLGQWLWENFLKPLGEWTGGIIVSVLGGIKDALKGIGDWVSENKEATQVFLGLFVAWKATTFVVEMGKATGAIIANTIATLASKFETIALIALYAKDAIAKGISTAATIAMTIATTGWNVAASIAAGVTTAFGAAVAFLTSPIGLVILAIGALIAIAVLLIKNWDKVKVAGERAWAGIKDAWQQAKSWFSTNVISPLSSAFKGLFNTIIDGMNWVIKGLNKLKIKIPDWVPGFGGQSWGININTIPRLANGGIVDQPTLAMVGDNKNARVDPEVISPLSKLQEMLGGSNQGIIDVLLLILEAIKEKDTQMLLKIGETELGQAAVRAIKAEQRRTGKSLIPV